MEQLIYKSWWKVLAVVLLVYVHLMGMLAPLKPGITGVMPGSARTGQEISVQVEGYNTHFNEAEDSLRAWLKLDEKRALAASKIAVKSETQVEITFQIPAYLPVDQRVQDLSLVLDNAIDGAFVRPSALLVTQDSIDPAMGEKTWVNATIQRVHTHEGITYPFRSILGETIRNTYFHVSLWLAMVILFIAALVYSIRYLRSQQVTDDEWASSLTTVGILYGLLGLITGAIWAKYTWGQFWSWDIKQFTTLIALLIYLAYFSLRSAFPDHERKARISAVYNIFAFTALIPLIYVLPRLTDSLHPGNGGNPALGGEDLDNTMRMVFYPAVLGWTLIGCWMASLYYRTQRAERLLNQ